MNHDITHCENGQCPNCGICQRYQAGIEAKEKHLEVYWFPNKTVPSNGSCEFFIPAEKKKL
jgi:hypothetical protein